MHIGQKLLADIRYALGVRYSIYIDQNDWELFKTPLPLDHNGEIHRPTFEKRQKKSIDIIKQILDIHG